MTGFGFPSRCRIKKTDDFSSVFNFRKRIPGGFLTLHYMPNVLSHARLGVIVGRKTARLAVQRNYMKRKLREFFRLHHQELGGVDILLRVQKPFGRNEQRQIDAELQELFGKLRKRLQHGPRA